MEFSTSLPTIQSLQKSPPNGVSGSGSFQSHLSSLNTQQRVRPVFHDLHVSKIPLPVSYSSSESRNYSFILASFVRGHFSVVPVSEASHMRSRVYPSSVKWIFYVYCFVSWVFFSASLYRGLGASGENQIPETNNDFKTSYLDALSHANRLAKLSAIQPPPKALEPFVIHAKADPSAVTACFWTREGDLDWLLPWTTQWNGPISLLVTTTMTSGPNRSSLLQNISRLLKHPSSNSSLFLHVLHLSPSTSDSPNAFLNLARLFSPTSSVLLVPGNISTPLLATLHSSLVSLPLLASRKPVILTNWTRKSYPYTPLSPILLPRDYPMWCTERFFPSQSRTADWDECLWQLWLETFGNVGLFANANWQPEMDISTSTSSVTAVIRRRLSRRYKSETCVLAMKRLEALVVDQSGKKGRVDAGKVRWLKSVCREWTTGVSP